MLTLILQGPLRRGLAFRLQACAFCIEDEPGKLPSTRKGSFEAGVQRKHV